MIIKEIPEFKTVFQKIDDNMALNSDPYIFKAEEIESLKERYISYLVNKKAKYLKSQNLFWDVLKELKDGC